MALSELNIGVSGITAAQKALEIIGHNVANANTPGYSRQVPSLSTAEPANLASFGPIGAGVKIDEVVRFKDEFLESSILTNTSLMADAEVQSESLKTIQLYLNELSGSGLSSLLDTFFESLQELSVDPESIGARNQLLQDGLNLVNSLNALDDQLKQLQYDASLQITTKVNELNGLTSEIASLNLQIVETELGEGNANDLKDRRDELVVQLSELADIRVLNKGFGRKDILIGGALIVHGGNSELMSTSSISPRIVAVNGMYNGFSGGELAGFLEFQNVIVPNYLGKLDTLAAGIIQEINNVHSEGVGLNGGFTSLSSTNAVVDDTTALDSAITTSGLPFAPITGSNLYINVTDASGATDVIIKSFVTIAAGETLTTLAAKLNAITGITSSASGGILTITATNAGDSFDFSKDLAFSSAINTIGGGSSAATLSGYYNGSDNDTFTMEVTGGTATIGSGSTSVTVRDSAGTTLAVLDVGSSYTVGDVLQIADGVSVSFSSGTVDTGTLDFDVTDDPDTSNVLTALGINTFFKGNNAASIGVSQYIIDDVNRIAAASSSSPGDNTNVLRLIGLQDKATTNNVTFNGFLQSVTAELGTETSNKIRKKDGYNALNISLQNRRQEISGVSIEEEMINIIRFQMAYQASARFITVIKDLSGTLMNM